MGQVLVASCARNFKQVPQAKICVLSDSKNSFTCFWILNFSELPDSYSTPWPIRKSLISSPCLTAKLAKRKTFQLVSGLLVEIIIASFNKKF